MAGDYQSFQKRKSQLIRKAKEGSLFIDDVSSELLTTISDPSSQLVLPSTLADGDLGWFTDDGIAFSGEVTESTVTSFGATEPTRREINQDTTTIAVTAQETKLTNIGLYTGNDLAALTPDPESGELIVTKPPRPRLRHVRALGLAVDEHEGEEIYIGRYLPRATVSRAPEQSFTAGDTALSWGLQFQSTLDSEAGYSERYFFAGPGWKALLEDMGFATAPVDGGGA